jgi:xylulokinase
VTRRMRTTIGVDVGTTGCKVAALNESGDVCATAYEAYPLETTELGTAELDPCLVWKAVTNSIRAVCESLPSAARPRSIAVTTAGEALVPLDANAAPLSNIVTSVDSRNVEAFRRSVGEIGETRFREHSGLAALPHYSVFRWRWFAETQPELYARTTTLAGHAEWLTAQLGANTPTTDRSLAARSLAYRVDEEVWDYDLIDMFGLDVGRLPSVVPAGSVVGTVSSKRAAELCVDEETTIIIGGLDQACAAFSLALPGEDTAMLSIGTTAVLGVEIAGTLPRFGLGPASDVHDGTTDRIPTGPHVRPNYRLALSGTPAGGALLKWFETKILGRAGDPAATVAGIEDHRTDVLALPHLGGSRVAFSDPDARGVILGLRFATSQRDITRALIDSVAYEVAVMLEQLGAAGVDVTRLRAVGGGSLSRAWLQIIADAVRLPVETAATSYAAAIGAAAMASRGTSLDTANPMVRVREVICPRADWFEYHDTRLRRFRDIYAALAEERSPPLVSAR